VGYSYSLACKAAVLGDRGLFAQAQECFEEALEAVRGANHQVEGSVLGWRAVVYLWQGRWEDARESAADAQRVAERVKSRFIAYGNRAKGAYASWSLQRTPELLQTAVNATDWLEERERKLNISLYYGWLADAMALTGRYTEARNLATRALARARKLDCLGLAMIYRALARASAGGHGRKLAERYLALALQAGRARESRHEIAVTRLCAAEIAARLDRRVEALALLDQAAAEFEPMRMTWHLSEAQRLRAGL
jgi:tetratricopeptide (TPR) repeat protein